jgi:hypothetical protein
LAFRLSNFDEIICCEARRLCQHRTGDGYLVMPRKTSDDVYSRSLTVAM